jgi:predicted lysophospholipase L1 biosynthesis ABC-type transport system permease subunit
VAAVRALLVERGVREVVLHPMARARLVAIAGRQVKPDDYPDERAK